MLEILVPPGRIPLVGPELFTVWKSRGEDLHPSLGPVCCEGWPCYEEQGISNPERGRLRLSQEKQLLLLCEVRAEERMCLLTVNSRAIDSRREKNSVVGPCICQLAQGFPIVWMDYWKMLLLPEDSGFLLVLDHSSCGTSMLGTWLTVKLRSIWFQCENSKYESFLPGKGSQYSG